MFRSKDDDDSHIRALEADLCQYFDKHNVHPAHAVLAMLHMVSAILVSGSNGKVEDQLEDKARLHVALTETLARAIKDKLLKL